MERKRNFFLILSITARYRVNLQKNTKEVINEYCSRRTTSFRISDWQTLIENAADPSHVPFCHHGVQGDRTIRVRHLRLVKILAPSEISFCRLHSCTKVKAVANLTLLTAFLET